MSHNEERNFIEFILYGCIAIFLFIIGMSIAAVFCAGASWAKFLDFAFDD